MPLNSRLLRAVDEPITNKSTPIAIPAFDDDEWIKFYAMRNAVDDFNANVMSMSNATSANKPIKGDGERLEEGEEDPDVVALEKKAEDATPLVDFVQNEGMRWAYIFRYMVHSFNIYEAPTPEEVASGALRGRKYDHTNIDDVDTVFKLIGGHFIDMLFGKGGGQKITPVRGPDGKPAGFPQADGVGTEGGTPGTADPSDTALGDASAGHQDPAVELPGPEGNAS